VPPNASAAAAAPAPPSRRARKKAETRREIYRAAMQLFRERGFDGVTIEAICREADVARRTFFLHFPTKGMLLYEFNRQVAEDFTASLSEPRGSALSELEQLVDLVGARLLADGPVMSAMLREYFTTPIANRVGDAETDDLYALLLAIFERGQARGEFRSTVSAPLAVMTFLSVSAAVLSGAVFPKDTRPEEARRQFFEVVLRGMLTE
jgi:AcrR family transcriptional regulator